MMREATELQESGDSPKHSARSVPSQLGKETSVMTTTAGVPDLAASPRRPSLLRPYVDAAAFREKSSSSSYPPQSGDTPPLLVLPQARTSGKVVPVYAPSGDERFEDKTGSATATIYESSSSESFVLEQRQGVKLKIDQSQIIWH